MRVSIGWRNTEQNPKVVLVFHLRLSEFRESGEERYLPIFAEKVFKFPALGILLDRQSAVFVGFVCISTLGLNLFAGHKDGYLDLTR